MENYNLTAELKKIAGGITSSDPNTNLNNINNGVGNLDTAMQGVATAINGLSIPNPGSNIDGVATAIGNISIPDTTTALGNIVTALQQINIQAVATDAVAVDGTRWDPAGNYIADLNIFWEGIGHVNTSTLHHPQSTGHGIVIAARNGAGAIQIYIPIDAYTDNTDPTIYMRFTQYANLGDWVNPWDYLYLDSYYIKYNDHYNIGATDVQGAIDKLSGATNGTLTINSNYATGTAFYQKCGKVVTVFLSDVRFIATPPNNSWTTSFATGLPKASNMVNNPKVYLMPYNSSFAAPVRLAFSNNDSNLYFHWSSTAPNRNADYNSTFTYCIQEVNA